MKPLWKALAQVLQNMVNHALLYRSRNSYRFVARNSTFPKEIKIIAQSKEIDGHALIGNIGGYIGLFLGNSIHVNI